MRRVVVTGLGAVSPLGVGARQTWTRLLAGHCGIVSTSSLGPEFAALPSQVAGLVPTATARATTTTTDNSHRFGSGSGSWNALDHVSAIELRQTAKFAQYGLAAASEALEDAGFRSNKANGGGLVGLDPEMTGVCLGSGIGNLEELYESSVAYYTATAGATGAGAGQGGKYKKLHPLFVPRLLINLGAGHVSLRYGLKGPNHAVTTACTTGAHSIGDAARFIQAGDADVMIAGGAESCIHPLAIGGFARSRSLATEFNGRPTEASRPFDKDRDGFVIGEGAACLVLEELEHARQRGARIYAELSGYGCSADAHHLTAPQADGAGAFLAMKKALRQAGIAPEKVDYINAHATSTPLGDAAENRAIKRLMLGEAGRSRAADVNVSSSKGAIGHLLGAAGAIEALFSVLALHEDVLPPTINLRSRTAEFDCNYVPNEAQEHSIGAVLTNSFGFGGTNASLCFTRAP